jgi:serine/threonine protein kinase
MQKESGEDFQSSASSVPSEERQGGAQNPESASAASMTEKAGHRIGRYRLMEEIGHGGCGVVYMAEQEKPVRRKVALKVIKLGMDTRQVVARFEAERQALALMDHSNIAKVLDAGATETGRPYFVMELVGGIKMTEYCERNRLSIRQRLDLFVQVCRAIQHAHQKGIIHRDIKPSNVLVATQDGVSVPKVIDFGIAKATQGRLTDQTVFTAFEQFIGTPAYMSPEQAQLGGLDVDTRSDIYSLGVLLYELLTGKTPFDSKELLSGGLELMRRTIQEREPPTPSTRLKKELSGKSEAKAETPGQEQRTASGQQANLKQQISLVRGDLDWIVMKCLQKERARRYETANGLAWDIERHLRNEPVIARPPSRLYEIQRLVRRHKLGFAAATVVVIALAGGAFASTLQAIRATRAERKSTQVAQFMKEMLQGAGPSKSLGRDPTMLKEILDKTAERLGKELTNQPEVELELREILAGTYWDLGIFKPMEQMAQHAVRLSRARFGEESAETARALFVLGTAERQLMNLDQAEASLREVFRVRKKLKARCVRELPHTAAELGLVLWLKDKAGEGEAVCREGLEVATREYGAESFQVARLLRILAYTLLGQERWSEAVAKDREALRVVRKLFAEEHPEVALTLNDLGFALGLEGNLDEAEATLRQALAMRRKLLGNEHDMTADSMAMLSGVLLDQTNRAKLEEAETLARESYAIKKKTVGHSADVLGNLITVLQVQDKDGDVVALCRKELPGLRAAVSPSEMTLLAEVLTGFADSLNSLEGSTEAEPLAREATGIFEKNRPRNWQMFNAERVLGTVLLGKKEYAGAEPLLLSGYQGMRQDKRLMGGSRRVYVKKALQQIVQLYEITDRPDQAAEWKQKLE